jgi:hypothetical protein
LIFLVGESRRVKLVLSSEKFYVQ